MSRTCCMRKQQSKRRRIQDSATLRDPETGIRVEKVREVREQLGKGTYSVTDRVDTVVEKIIKDLS
jgi:anti-sigma28 factor (negative regulator of flagellin synthesis)